MVNPEYRREGVLVVSRMPEHKKRSDDPRAGVPQRLVAIKDPAVRTGDGYYWIARDEAVAFLPLLPERDDEAFAVRVPVTFRPSMYNLVSFSAKDVRFAPTQMAKQ